MAGKKTKKTISDSPKDQALLEAIAQIEKNFGAGSIMKLGDDKHINIPAISTGSIGLDIATGIGGIPKGRITEIFGPESSGKTTITLHVIAEAQKNGGRAAFIDAEHALDPEYAKKLGVNIDELLVAQPDNGEQALEICETLVRSNALDVIVVDSVAALVPRAELEGNMGDAIIGLQARLMSQALRKLTGFINKSGTAVIFINQLREKIPMTGYGAGGETTTGGRALKFYSSMRISVKKIDNIKKGDDVLGSVTFVKMMKNKLSPPFKTARFDMMYGEGISQVAEVIDMAINYDILSKAGAWISYNGDNIGQGKENARQFLISNPDIYEEIKEKTLAIGTGKDLEDEEKEDDDYIGEGINLEEELRKFDDYEVDEDGVIL